MVEFMIEIGTFNRLRLDRIMSVGAFLTDGKQDILLPKKFVPEDLPMGEMLRVFVYTDSEDRPVATTQIPHAIVGEFASLKILSVSGVGAFADWGLDKDLLIPFAEQRRRLEEGERTVVRVLLDKETNRVIGSTKLSRFLKPADPDTPLGKEVEVLFVERMSTGYRCIVDDAHSGVLYDDEVFERLFLGRRKTGYIKKIAEDGSIVLSLSPQGYKGAVGKADDVLSRLRNAGGFLPLGDNSSPEEIRSAFGMSKGSYKKLIGTLRREGKIDIEEHGIRLL